MDRYILSEQWFGFLHEVNRGLTNAYSEARERGIDQKTIALALNMSPDEVSRYLSGRQNMNVRTIHNLARAMGYRPRVIFERLPAADVIADPASLAE